MTNFYLGLIIGFSLILAIGPQNVFVIEKGLKNNFTFLVCFICSVSDTLLIILGIFLFYFFKNQLTESIILILDILLVIYLLWYSFTRLQLILKKSKLILNKSAIDNLNSTIIKTLVITYFNPHVYSDTIIYLGNASKKLDFIEKIYFGVGASLASFSFFFFIGYGANYFSNYLNNYKSWIMINGFVFIFMLGFAIKIILFDII